MTKPIKCPYCQAPAERVLGTEIYPRRIELHKSVFWICRPCDARVGCKPNTDIPLGTLADKRLRQARKKAHLALDRIWKENLCTRDYLYIIMAKAFKKKIHIGESNIEQCYAIEYWAKQTYLWRKIQQLNKEGYSYNTMLNVIHKIRTQE